MADSPRKRYSRSPSPPLRKAQSRSRSRSMSRSRSRSWSPQRPRSRSRGRSRANDMNPGNTLYVTGLSTRVTERDLEDHFSREGKVASCFLVVEPRTRISRGFAFITMDSLEGANRCVKHLDQSVLEGRYITVEKAFMSRRKRPRTPTPGHYLGLKNSRDESPQGGDRGRYRGGSSRDDYGYHRSPRRSPYRGGHVFSPRRSPYRGGREYSPRRTPYGGGREYSPRHSPYGGRSRRERSRSLPYSPYGSPDRKYAHDSR